MTNDDRKGGGVNLNFTDVICERPLTAIFYHLAYVMVNWSKNFNHDPGQIFNNTVVKILTMTMAKPNF